MKEFAQIAPIPAPGHGIVMSESVSGKPSKGDFESMARRRFQDPTPKREGKWWFLLVWQDQFKEGRTQRRRKRIKLAPASMPVREVNKIAAEMLRPLNQGLVTIGSATKFQDFITEVYKPIVMPLMAASTQDRYAGVLKNYLTPAFGELCLREITALSVQRYFSGMASSPLEHESKDKIRDVLSSACVAAVQYGFLIKNPVEGIKLPPPKKGKKSKPYVTPDQFEVFVARIREPYASMVYVAVYTGLRVSELVGLRWRNVHADSITIAERYCRGDWGAPKSESSSATVPVNACVIDRIMGLKSLEVRVKAGRAVRRHRVVKSDGPDDLVFQSLRTGAPMRDNNILVRHIKPAARELNIGWVNWRVLRTSFATWLKLAGADVKDAQALMRHSRASTTLDIYQQFVPESQRKVVTKLSRLRSSAAAD
jgi:integrase